MVQGGWVVDSMWGVTLILPLKTWVLGPQVATYSHVGSLLQNPSRYPSEGSTEMQRDPVRRPGLLTFGQDGYSIVGAKLSFVVVALLSCVRLFATPWTAAYQAPPSMDFPGKSTGVECHCLLNTVQFLGRNAPLLLRVICPVWPPGVMQKYRQLKMNFHVPV